jgi:two-component system response regulator NreC
MRILIVDDNERVRRGIAGVLAYAQDYELCGEALSGEDGIERARELRPDLVLLDVSMPGIDGLETARQLRRQHPSVKIIILSQHDQQALLPQALEAGANGCLDKSRIAHDLLKAIKSLFGDSKGE